jgi:hypothetical protein
VLEVLHPTFNPNVVRAGRNTVKRRQVYGLQRTGLDVEGQINLLKMASRWLEAQTVLCRYVTSVHADPAAEIGAGIEAVRILKYPQLCQQPARS